MRNIKLTIAYDGTSFKGWQMQPDEVTVQELLEKRLKSMFKQDIKLVVSGRTDTGVHALGQVANFVFDSNIEVERLPLAINAVLNEDIRVLSAEEVDMEFNARFSAKKKTYKYRICNSLIADPFLNRFAYTVPYKFDFKKLDEIGEILEGEHDFAAFMSVGSEPYSTIRTIYSFEYEIIGNLLEIRITGNGFLYNMVRIIIGTIIQVISGVRDIDCFRRAIKSGDRNELGPTAKASGLFLEKVDYTDK